MSVGIYGGRFLRGHATKVAVEAFQSAFGALITRIEPNAFMLELEGAGGVETALFLNAQDEDTNSFCVSRPVEDGRLYEALLEVARMNGVVLYAPGSPPVVAHEGTAEHLPEDMIESLGPALYVGLSLIHI